MFAQVQVDTLYSAVLKYSEVWHEILTTDQPSVVIGNAHVICDYDDILKVDSMIFQAGSSIVTTEIYFINSHFSSDFSIDSRTELAIRGIEFNGQISFLNCSGIKSLIFESCQFKNGLVLKSNLDGCALNGCVVEKFLTLGETGLAINFIDINSSEISLSSQDKTIQGFDWYMGEREGNHFRIVNSVVSSVNNDAWLKLSYVNTVWIDGSSFDLPLVIATDQLEEFNSFFPRFERITFSGFPDPLNFNCKWTDLEGHFANDWAESTDRVDTIVFFDGYESSLEDVYAYDELIAKYKTLHDLYKTRGDMESANGSYVEMKDVETRRLLYISRQDGGLNNYLNYKLNVGLALFADYGTNPVKCIIYAMYVILFFSGFYFLFYSKWDRIDHKFMLRRSAIFIHFFKGEQNREELYSAKYKAQIHSFEEFKKNMSEARGQIPFFFFLFLKPVYWTARRKIILNEWFYNRLDFTRKSWISLSKKQKIFYGFLYFLALIIYGIYLIVVKFTTALVISFNSFSSLGFGSLNLIGFTRYVAMIEGSIGWLLLSVFSIALFSQIMQG